MHFATSILALLPLIGTIIAAPTSDAATVKQIEFEYYPKAVADCDSTTLSANIINTTGKCYDLHHSATSFHIGGPTTDAQIAKGCKVVGYADKGCKGAVNLDLAGPTSRTTCYTVGESMGVRSPVKSVILSC